MSVPNEFKRPRFPWGISDPPRTRKTSRICPRLWFLFSALNVLVFIQLHPEVLYINLECAFITNWDFPGTSRNAISPPYFEIQKIRRKSLGVTSFAYNIFHLLFFLFVEKETNGKKNLGFEKKSGTPVFFCEQEVFLKGKNCLEKTIPMLPAWSWGLHKSQSSGRKRNEHFVWKKKEKRQS